MCIESELPVLLLLRVAVVRAHHHRAIQPVQQPDLRTDLLALSTEHGMFNDG